jgi:7-keto-8-aminopelargonate synthetase-like enzyme
MPRLAISASSARTVQLEGRSLVYFGGCGYLGLAHHPRVVAELAEGAKRFGVSAGASRETTGNCVAYDELEQQLALRLEVPAALLTPEGYTANFVAAQALARERRVALVDDRSHPSVFDAAHAARLEVHVWPHRDLENLRTLLREHAKAAVVATDGVFPSRGELAPADGLVALAHEFGAASWIDDCHGTGVVGARGRGVLEHFGLSGDDVVLTSTLSKALGCYGGVVAGSREFVAAAREHSQAYIGSTPPPPAVACAASIALELAFADTNLLERLRANTTVLREGFARLRLRVPAEPLPVFAFALEDAASMERLHAGLRDEGLFAPYVKYLGSPQAGHFRIVVNAAHESEDLQRLLAGLARGLRRDPEPASERASA